MNINMQSRHMLFLQFGLILQAGYGLEQGLHLIAEQLDEQELKTLVCRLNEEREKQQHWQILLLLVRYLMISRSI